MARTNLATIEAADLRQVLVRRHTAMHIAYMGTQRIQPSDTAAIIRCTFLETQQSDRRPEHCISRPRGACPSSMVHDRDLCHGPFGDNAAPVHAGPTPCVDMDERAGVRRETTGRPHEWTTQRAAEIWNTLHCRTYPPADHAKQLADEVAAVMEAQLGAMQSVLQCERHAALGRRHDPPLARSTALRFNQVLAVTATSEPPSAAQSTTGTGDDREDDASAAQTLEHATAARSAESLCLHDRPLLRTACLEGYARTQTREIPANGMLSLSAHIGQLAETCASGWLNTADGKGEPTLVHIFAPDTVDAELYEAARAAYEAGRHEDPSEPLNFPRHTETRHHTEHTRTGVNLARHLHAWMYQARGLHSAITPEWDLAPTWNHVTQTWDSSRDGSIWSRRTHEDRPLYTVGPDPQQLTDDMLPTEDNTDKQYMTNVPPHSTRTRLDHMSWPPMVSKAVPAAAGPD
jgi:hypothetical protein